MKRLEVLKVPSDKSWFSIESIKSKRLLFSDYVLKPSSSDNRGSDYYFWLEIRCGRNFCRKSKKVLFWICGMSS